MKIVAISVLIFLGGVVSALALPEDVLKQIVFTQKPGAVVPAGLAFRDETGAPVKLGGYFGKKPVILILGYYRCPMLCSAVLNGLIGGLQDLKEDAGKDFEIVSVSIDPRETPALAAAKKGNYLARYARTDAVQGWHFLTGDEPAISQLASAVGFKYAYDPDSGQYAHPSGITILTPAGRVSHYLFGVTFSGRDLRTALADAADAKIGSLIQQFFFLCFHYSPLTGKYSGLVMVVVRCMGVAVPLSLVVLIARRKA